MKNLAQKQLSSKPLLQVHSWFFFLYLICRCKFVVMIWNSNKFLVNRGLLALGKALGVTKNKKKSHFTNWTLQLSGVPLVLNSAYKGSSLTLEDNCKQVNKQLEQRTKSLNLFEPAKHAWIPSNKRPVAKN